MLFWARRRACHCKYRQEEVVPGTMAGVKYGREEIKQLGLPLAAHTPLQHGD